MTEPKRVTLTDAMIKAALLPPGKKEHFMHDAEQPGLLLRIRDSGAKTFQFRSRDLARITLGRWPGIKVAAVRRAAAQHAGDQARGINVFRQQSEARAAAKAEAARASLGALIAEDGPYEANLKQRKTVNAATALSSLRRNLLPGHGSSDVRSLTRRDITAEMDKLAALGKLGAAQDLRKHASVFLNWAEKLGHVDHNVLMGMRQEKQTRAERLGKRGKGRALSDEEIRAVWLACGKQGAFGLSVRMALLGGARRSEPSFLEWQRNVMDDRITFDERWTKGGKHHDIPRTQLVDQVLAAAKHFRRATSDLVFPGQRGTPISGFTRSVSQLIEQAGTAKWSMHDLRRTLRTVMSRCGYDDQVQRACVGQAAPAFDAIYNRDEGWQVRRWAFEAAHSYIAAVIEGRDTTDVIGYERATNPLHVRRAELIARLHQHEQELVS